VIWLHPVALFALAAVAAPILIHILVQRRAERFAFPTLRFLRPTRLAAIRRHVLEDPLLLAVRMAIVVLGAGAVAGPLVVTPARRDAWHRRVVRAVVADAAVARNRAAVTSGSAVYRAAEFRVPVLADGIRRAVDWLDHAPPARRELLIVAPLTIGSLSDADIAAVPADVGIAFARAGTPPAARTVGYGRIRSTGGAIDRDVMLAGAATSVHDIPTGGESSAGDALPIEVVAPEQARPLVDAAIAAVLSQRVWSPPPGRRARLIVAAAGDADALRTTAIRGSLEPWMADAIARMARDPDLQQTAGQTTGAIADGRVDNAPWSRVALSADHQPLIAAGAFADRLLVVCGASPADVVMPILVRAIVNAIAVVPDLAPVEVVRIADARLNGWSRPAAVPATPRIDAVDADDRRWLWIGVLALLAIETFLRRSAHMRSATSEPDEIVRVA
jgi:hypothetical protein